MSDHNPVPQRGHGVKKGKVRRLIPLAAILAIGLSATSATVAQAKPKKQIVYPVKVTIKIRTTEYPPGSPWPEAFPGRPAVVIFGRITSPQPACVQKRPVSIREEEVLGTKTYVTPNKYPGIVSDSTGAWQGEVIPDVWFRSPTGVSIRETIRRGDLKLRAKVARKRLSKHHVCVQAISTYLKA
jgi:hypothetical protein